MYMREPIMICTLIPKVMGRESKQTLSWDKLISKSSRLLWLCGLGLKSHGGIFKVRR